MSDEALVISAVRRGAGGVPGRADRAGRPAAARRPDHRDQRGRHDLLHTRTGELHAIISLLHWVFLGGDFV